MSFDGRTALVTGGASGLGLELARQLSLAGAKVVICGRNEQKLAEAAKAIPDLATITCDLGRAEDRAMLVEQINKDFPDLSLVIHNAAMQNSPDFGGSANGEHLLEEINVNLVAPVDLTWHLVPLLKQQPRANIVFISSALARVPKKSAPVYCATKAGISNFARGLSYQLEDHGIVVSEAIPALIKTAMTEGRDGKNIMAAVDVASEVLSGSARGLLEIRIGQAKLLYKMHRLLPQLAYKILGNE